MKNAEAQEMKNAEAQEMKTHDAHDMKIAESQDIKNAKTKDKKFYVVFNSLNPDFLFPTTNDAKKIKYLLLNNKLKKIKKHLKQENILFIDYNKYILENYNKNNVSTIFKKIDGHWDHYTERGFFELTEQINNKLIK